MNERIARQIEEMKKQTIGVEVEMNNIRRDKDIIHGQHGMRTEGNGNSRRMSALRDRMIKNASW